MVYHLSHKGFLEDEKAHVVLTDRPESYLCPPNTQTTQTNRVCQNQTSLLGLLEPHYIITVMTVRSG